MRKVNVLGIDLTIGSYHSFLEEFIHLALSGKKAYVCVANVHMLIEAYQSNEFTDVVNNATICTPDGIPLVWALKLFHKIKQERVAGMDILPDLLSHLEKNSLSVFFYGGSSEMLNKTSQHLENRYPSLSIAGTHSPPFRQLTSQEESDHVNLINSSGAKLLFVSLGCPKQEKWMSSMKDRISIPMIGIGGALPVMVGMQSRAPHWVQNAGLEWLYRLVQEPRRLFKRYALTNTIFIYLLTKTYIKGLNRKNVHVDKKNFPLNK